ncbi:hypothetical protein VTK73DRAFT_2791 [Phialemonium thermophilum]|uniref:Uncharacterized protein n=1 Tax=Phialemonium thermophilum TaxID=223376 RepID=A0ABR3VP18_9PEZI
MHLPASRRVTAQWTPWNGHVSGALSKRGFANRCRQRDAGIFHVSLHVSATTKCIWFTPALLLVEPGQPLLGTWPNRQYGAREPKDTSRRLLAASLPHPSWRGASAVRDWDGTHLCLVQHSVLVTSTQNTHLDCGIETHTLTAGETQKHTQEPGAVLGGAGDQRPPERMQKPLRSCSTAGIWVAPRCAEHDSTLALGSGACFASLHPVVRSSETKLFAQGRSACEHSPERPPWTAGLGPWAIRSSTGLDTRRGVFLLFVFIWGAPERSRECRHWGARRGGMGR